MQGDGSRRADPMGGKLDEENEEEREDAAGCGMNMEIPIRSGTREKAVGGKTGGMDTLDKEILARGSHGTAASAHHNGWRGE